MVAPEFPQTEKGRDVKKPEMDPRKEKPDRKETDPNWGIPDSTNLPLEDQPSPQMANHAADETSHTANKSQPIKGQADFMKPERADADSNRQSGAV